MRTVLTTALCVAAITLGVVATALGSDTIGHVGIVVAAGGCMMIVLNDNARTRRQVRTALRPQDPPEPPDVTRLH